ncbi:MAG TPA: GNAT family N-acetyltransferase [Acidimicrobiales bacterium]|nr:GNAT family N-acetyltransferase [Acidimicrobiales bacterium]
MRVVELEAVATLDLRRRVLRWHRPHAPAAYPEDQQPGTVHLGVVDDEDRVVAVATLFPEPTAHRPGARAARLRGMAVDPAVQGRGVGSLLLAAVVARAAADGHAVLWANGRDDAVGFYERHGWRVVGDGFESVGLPHHVVLVDL